MIATNVQGTANLLRAAERSGVEAFVNSGSSSEYGYKDHAPAEDEWIDPNSNYAATKAAATLLCRFTAQQADIRITTLRLYSAYGPYEEPRRLVPTLVMKGLDGHLPPLVNPKVARDYVHVDDVCEAYVLAAATPVHERGAVFNVGTGVQTTLEDIVGIARRLMAIPEEPNWGSMPERSWDTNVWVSNPSRIKAQLAWSPRHSIDSGLKQTIDWFKSHAGKLEQYHAS
jgi:dolichol-phosphate mannosyltransferase